MEPATTVSRPLFDIQIRGTIARATERICRPMPALPVDIFRVLVGLLSSAYFVHLYVEVADFSAPDGLLDHELISQLFWYTRIGLFGPLMPADAFRAVFLFAAIASWGLVIGYRVKPIATALFLIAVSAYRWNFLVIYVDDAIMHLMLFWIILLPVGRTLVLSEWLHDRTESSTRWKRELVPGGTVRLFLVNLSLVYLVAGLWKWTSPMWRDGSALYAALRMPISYAPDFWQPRHIPILRLANYGAMILEPLLPLMLVLPAKSRLKWTLFGGCVAFHLGIIATMMIPYANFACLAAAPIVFRKEIMEWLGGSSAIASCNQPARLCWCTRSALAFVSVLILAMTAEIHVPAWRFSSRSDQLASTGQTDTASQRMTLASSGGTAKVSVMDGRVGFLQTEHNIFYSPLWLIGIAQSYRLFDWIDDRNFHTNYAILEERPGGAVRSIAPREMFPSTLRSVLLQGYLHDITWGRVPRNRAAEFKAKLAARFANRFCRTRNNSGQINVWSRVERIQANATLKSATPELLIAFACVSGKALLRIPQPTAPPLIAAAR